MKSILLILFLFIYSFSFAQITFEQVASPNDFNIGAIRKSQIGEYFVQASNDYYSIYSSLNGQVWTKSSLPAYHSLGDIQFFSDGTPLLLDDYNNHNLIRRNGSWYELDVPGGNNGEEACFIKDDTLFIYEDQVFAYSLDKGQNFINLFIATDTITDHAAHLFKLGSYFYLHHTSGASKDYLSVFDSHGNRVLYEDLSDLGFVYITHTCDQLLINDYQDYYLLTGLNLQQGSTSSLLPSFHFYSELTAENNRWYIHDGNYLYRSDVCNFTWDTVATDNLIDINNEFWASPQGDFFIYNRIHDKFYEQPNGSAQWEEKRPDINYAFVEYIDESTQNKQFALTSNALFHKHNIDSNWIEVDSIVTTDYDVQYGPNGDLYINRKTDILYSTDNGTSFTILQLPPSQFPEIEFSMRVLDDGVLFVHDLNLGETYYSLNNGQDWIPTGITFTYDDLLVRKIDHNIVIANLDGYFDVTTINVITGEQTYSEMDVSFLYSTESSVMQDDGTIYFSAYDINGVNPEGLFRYRIGQGVEYFEFDPLFLSSRLTSVGNDLYAFTPFQYYAFDGQTAEAFNYIGLPIGDNTRFILSTNDYVYAIQDYHSIYRSKEPLSYPQYITGTVYHDEIPDCIADTLDAGLQYWQVKVEGQDYLRIKTTNAEGKFKFSVPKGDYTISAQPVNSNWDLCEDSYPVSVYENQITAQQDFLAHALSSCATLDLDFSTPLLRRCFNNVYHLTVRNTGPEASTGSSLTLHLDPYFEFLSASIPYTLVGDSTVKFELGALEVNEQVSFQMNVYVSCDAVLGQEHCITGVVNDENGCGNNRSSYTECQKNIGSNDPNDKRTFNEAGEETDLIEKGEYIYYHIRFQNTGTDTAFRVRILDPLSDKLDFSTLEILSASHPYDYVITDGPALSVTFDHILLPDSSINEAASHGFIKFRVKPLPQYDYGTNIPNQASIYFDFNQAIITNEVTLMIQHIVGTKEAKDLLQFDLFPNPTKYEIFITASESDLKRIDVYQVIDPLGQIILQSNYSNGTGIKVDHLVPGVYYLCVKEKGNVVGMKKFSKL